jgi:hypothetical protein
MIKSIIMRQKRIILSWGPKLITVLIFLLLADYTFAASTWTGNISTDWGNPSNWSGTAPNSNTPDLDIVIPSSPIGGRFPILSKRTFSIKKLTIEAGATLTQTGGYLTLNDDLFIAPGPPPGEYNQSNGTIQMTKDWKNEGIFNASGGTVRFSPSANGGAFENGSNQFFNIEIDDGVQPTFDNADGNNILIAGNFVNNNADLSITDKATFTFNGSGDQTIYSASNPLPDNTTFGNLVISKPSGTLQLLSDLAVDDTYTDPNEILDKNGYELWVAGVPLPVELSYFSAVILDNEVKLSWRTITEVNNYGFEVERTPHQSPPYQGGEGDTRGDWEMIGFVEGHGNSNSPKEYVFNDASVNFAGTYFYRLKQIDNDGSYEYSKKLAVDFASPIIFKLRQNYPNPFNPSTAISFSLPVSSDVSLIIFNALGAEIITLVESFLESGVHTYIFNADGLTSGIYIYQLSTSEAAQTRKMLYLK